MAANKPYYNYMAVHGTIIHDDGDGDGDDDDDDSGAAGVNVPLCGQTHQLLAMTMSGRRGRNQQHHHHQQQQQQQQQQHQQQQQQQQAAISSLATIQPIPMSPPVIRNNSIVNLFSMNKSPLYTYDPNSKRPNPHHQGAAVLLPGHRSNNSNALPNAAIQTPGTWGSGGVVGADTGRPRMLANDNDNDNDEAAAAAALAGGVWPPRSYHCTFCRREFRSAQALGGHMNVHRRDRARLRQSSSPPPPFSPPPPPDALSVTTTTPPTPPRPSTGTTIFSPDFFFSSKPPTKHPPMMPPRAPDPADHTRDLPAKIYTYNPRRPSATSFNHHFIIATPPPPTTTTTTSSSTTSTTSTTKTTHDSHDLQVLRSHGPRLAKKPFTLDRGLGTDTSYTFEYPGVNPPTKLVDLELRLGHDIVK